MRHLTKQQLHSMTFHYMSHALQAGVGIGYTVREEARTHLSLDWLATRRSPIGCSSVNGTAKPSIAWPHCSIGQGDTSITRIKTLEQCVHTFLTDMVLLADRPAVEHVWRNAGEKDMLGMHIFIFSMDTLYSRLWIPPNK